MSLGAVLVRSLRYLVPIAVLSAIAWVPIGWVAFGVVAPANVMQARVVLRIAWLCAASGLVAMLVLVAGIAPMVAGDRLSQLRALGRGLRGMVRAIVPAIVVLCAVAMGVLALVVPGVILWGLLVLAPASEADGVRAKLADSVRIVRARWVPIAIVLALTGLGLAAVVAVQQFLLPTPLGKSPTREQLAMFPQLVRMTAIAAAAIVPVAAVMLAAIRATVRPR